MPPQVQQARQLAEKLASQSGGNATAIYNALTNSKHPNNSPDLAMIQANYHQQQQQILTNPLVAAAKFAAGEIAAKVVNKKI